MYWFKEHSYKTLESAIAAYEEYKKNERILNGEGLAPLPRNPNFHNHFQEVVPGVIKEVSAYDTLGNKIATWGASSQIDTRALTYVGFGSPDISDAPIGTVYVDIANYSDNTSTAAKGNKNIANCRNCGAIIKGCVCEYCGTAY